MHYFSIDIETTGLDPLEAQILEFGAVFDDLKSPIEELPIFHAYLNHPKLYGEAYALSMHPVILRRIATQEDGYNYLQPEELPVKFMSWCREYTDQKIVVAGKNYGIFDHQFLKRLPGWEDEVKTHHRIIDPAMFWLRPEDNVPPDSSTCLERAGFEANVKHTAVEDALDVIRVVREGMKRLWGQTQLES